MTRNETETWFVHSRQTNFKDFSRTNIYESFHGLRFIQLVIAFAKCQQAKILPIGALLNLFRIVMKYTS